MPSISREYRLLKNKLVRKTIGKIATLKRVAAIGNVTVKSLLITLSVKIKEVADEEVQIEINGKIIGSHTQELRQEDIKRIIKDIHAGKDTEQIKKDFAAVLEGVGAHELVQVEQQLIKEGLPVEEVRSLCNIHSQIFEEGLARQSIPGVPAGHPVQIMLLENLELEKKIAIVRKAGINADTLSEQLKDLNTIEIHYVRIENQLFPILEQHGITGPTQVMWAKHDEIRSFFKTAMNEESRTAEDLETLLREIEGMITKEEHILFPLALEVLSDEDWAQVQDGEQDLGYAWIDPQDKWLPMRDHVDIRDEETDIGDLKLEVGHLSCELLNLMLCHLPLEVSFINENDEVVYYNQTEERIFPRSPAVIGRKVQNCHPQKSVDTVERILRSFKDGTKDSAEFWIRMKGMFLLIRYFAVRDKHAVYKGCLEVTQNITEIRKLQGEQRLLDWK